MYYDKPTRQLRCDDHTVMKTLHCPYKRQELSLYYQDARTLSCDTCHHSLRIAHEHSEQELKQVLSENPTTCLVVDDRYIPGFFAEPLG